MTVLNHQQVLPYLHNCCGTFQLDGDTGYARFTPEQLEYYGNRNDPDFVRSHTSAGIYLECVTDALEISFEYRIYTEKGAWMTQSGIDIWEDGVLAENIPLVVSDSQWTTVRYTRSKQEPSTLRIWFPTGVIFLPRAFALGDARPTPTKARQIIFYGDSLTQSSYIPTPSLSWFCFVAEQLEAEYINRGIGSFPFVPDSLPSVADAAPDLLLIEYGLNDMVHTPDNDVAALNAKEWLTRMLRLYPKAEAYCLLPAFLCREADQKYWPRLFDFIPRLKAVCDELGVPCIPGEKLIPSLPQLFEEDHVHFNEAGSAIFAHNLLRYLKEMKANK